MGFNVDLCLVKCLVMAVIELPGAAPEPRSCYQIDTFES